MTESFLFVSHVSKDRSAALELVGELERRGVRCWIAPRDVRPGKPFDDEIAEAIETSSALLLIFSDRCNESDYIRREVTVAGESQKTIIPLRIENAQPKRGLRMRLSDLHWIDAFAVREKALDQVVSAVNASARPSDTTEARRDSGSKEGRSQPDPWTARVEESSSRGFWLAIHNSKERHKVGSHWVIMKKDQLLDGRKLLADYLTLDGLVLDEKKIADAKHAPVQIYRFKINDDNFELMLRLDSDSKRRIKRIKLSANDQNILSWEA